MAHTAILVKNGNLYSLHYHGLWDQNTTTIGGGNADDIFSTDFVEVWSHSVSGEDEKVRLFGGFDTTLVIDEGDVTVAVRDMWGDGTGKYGKVIDEDVDWFEKEEGTARVVTLNNGWKHKVVLLEK